MGTPLPNTNTYKSFGASGAIVGDTIFYFGGAASIGNFPIQNVLRMGVIDKNDPTQIAWSDTVVDAALFGYRMAATTVNGNVHWIGGSNQTYNYNGKAYANNQGVPPNNRNLVLLPGAMKFVSYTSQGAAYPMDLRGIAETSATTRYLAGGMQANQRVSRKMLKLEYVVGPVAINELEEITIGIKIYPNPARSRLEVELGETPTDLVLLDGIGSTVMIMSNVNGQTQLDVSKLSPGLYFLQILSAKGTISRQVVIQH